MSYLMNVLETIRDEIILRKTVYRPFVVGVNGIDTAGKTEFSRKLEENLVKHGFKVQLIHIDDFHNPKEIRYSGENEVENYFYRSLNLELLLDEILEPIKKDNKLDKTIMLLSLDTDKYELFRSYNVDKDTIVILEGVFIFREEIRNYLDLKVFLQVPFELCKERAEKRDVPKFGKDILKKYDFKYTPTQRKYLEMFPPNELADIIIDNSDWNKPYIVRKISLEKRNEKS
jgi:uridine kinase